jgi:hypothetical protein
MTDRPPVLDAMIRQAEAAASDQIDPLAVVSLLLKLTIRSEADPYLLIGQLVEGIAVAAKSRIPPEKQTEVGMETLGLLRNRLAALGVI